MSDPRFSIIPAGAVLDPRIEPRDLQVLCLFGKHTDRKGWCRRSQVTMAKEIGCARSTVQGSIDRLIAAGWLQKRPANDLHTPGVRDSAHEYRVVLDTPDEPQDVVDTVPTGRQTPADRSAPPAAPVSAPPADPCVGTYVNDPLSNAKNPQEPPPAGGVGAPVFDRLWEIFPRRPGSVRSSARRAFDAIDPAEWPLLERAADHVAAEFAEECRARGETAETRARFAPFLANWLSSEAWREIAAAAPADAAQAEDLVVFGPTDPEFKAVARLREKAIPLGNSGKATFRRAEVEEAMRGAA